MNARAAKVCTNPKAGLVVTQVAAVAPGAEQTWGCRAEVEDVVSVTEKAEPPGRDSTVGLALVVGAGLGTTTGLLLWDAPGIAIGAGLGAAVGIVVGAVWDGMRSKG